MSRDRIEQRRFGRYAPGRFLKRSVYRSRLFIGPPVLAGQAGTAIQNEAIANEHTRRASSGLIPFYRLAMSPALYFSRHPLAVVLVAGDLPAGLLKSCSPPQKDFEAGLGHCGALIS